jgi:hypothetical protein
VVVQAAHVVLHQVTRLDITVAVAAAAILAEPTCLVLTQLLEILQVPACNQTCQATAEATVMASKVAAQPLLVMLNQVVAVEAQAVLELLRQFTQVLKVVREQQAKVVQDEPVLSLE